MPHQDLLLALTPTGYDLTGVVEDELVRMRDRFLVQFLSQRARERGSLFLSELAAGRIKTNADVVTLFALATTQLIEDMRQFAEDLYPYRAELIEFSFINARTLRLRFTVFTNRGNIANNIVVSA